MYNDYTTRMFQATKSLYGKESRKLSTREKGLTSNENEEIKIVTNFCQTVFRWENEEDIGRYPSKKHENSIHKIRD